VSTMAVPRPNLPMGKSIRAGWERISVYLPVILMGVIALGTYWLARNSPTLGPAQNRVAPTHDPDAFMRRFSVRSFDVNGRLKSEVHGTEGRHYPDTDTTEIDQPRLRAIGERGEVTLASARRAVSNADGSEVQLFGDAVITREASIDAAGRVQPRMEFRGDFLHAFMNTERVTSNKPVVLVRGDNKFTADSMEFDNITQVLQLRGHVSGVLMPRP
jgi:lipopolysaccharide export system protein LptC